MGDEIGKVYEFVFKGLLTDESLDKAGRKTRNSIGLANDQITKTLSIPMMDDDLIARAKQMSIIYTAIAAFENSVRELVEGILAENDGEDWWNNVAKGIKDGAEKRLKDEQKAKWHTQRGADPINYTTLGNLHTMMRHKWDFFEPYIRDLEWAKTIFDAIERSRNVIMHSGTLDKEDIERLGIYIRDWIKQVGS